MQIAEPPRETARAAPRGVVTSRPPSILIVPGLNNSGPDHWQSHWEQTLPNTHRVEQAEWDRPRLGDWVASLLESVRAYPGSLLVAHSLGCALVAHLAAINRGKGIAGALLVAPADVDRDGPHHDLLDGFSPLPLNPLPFPSIVVASRTDPYVTLERSAHFARAWGARFVDLGAAGHINVASGHRRWVKGRAMLADLVQQANVTSIVDSGQIRS